MALTKRQAAALAKGRAALEREEKRKTTKRKTTKLSAAEQRKLLNAALR
jgi:hypothetical protein